MTAEITDVGPLDWRVSIVDKSGRPSPEFQRRWNTNRSNTGLAITSIGLNAPSIFSVSGSPLTANGSISFTLVSEAANSVFAGPGSGGSAVPTFRSLVAADIPALSYVTSVGLTVPSFLSVSGSPITSSGTLAVTLATQAAHAVMIGPTSGTATPTFRSLVTSDLPAGVGTVTSVALTAPAIFSVGGSPITTAGTLALSLATQTANLVWAGPTTGSAAIPTFRALVAADIPALSYVTSVALTVPAFLSVSGSPITGSGTLAVTLATQSANLLFAGPTTGAAATPTFRSLVTADLPAGVGTVTSVALTAPAEFSVSGSPITASGTLAITKATQTANFVWSGPTTGAAAVPTFRALVAADIPSLSYVTSVGLNLPSSVFTISNSPVTTSGTLTGTFKTQVANTVFSGPDSGGVATPAFRALVAADIPNLSATYLPLHSTADAALRWSNARTITVTGASTGSMVLDGSANVTLNLSAGSIAGTVTSVAASVPGTLLAVGGSPITTSGTLSFSLVNQNPNLVFAGPSSGGVSGQPAFRSLVAADIPALSYVTSVGLTVPAFLSVSGSPITGSGTLAVTLATQTAANVFAGPTSGSAATPTFRTLTLTDLPFLNANTAPYVAPLTASSVIQIQGADNQVVRFEQISSGSSGQMAFRVAGTSGTIASPHATTVGLGGTFAMFGHNGTSWTTTGAANFGFVANSTWSLTNQETIMQFGVTALNSTTRVTTTILDSNGDFRPNADNTYNSGQATFYWKGVYGYTVYHKPVTVATLPTAASGLDGAIAFVTDGTSPVSGTAISGGGSVHTPVYCDGSGTPAWKSLIGSSGGGGGLTKIAQVVTSGAASSITFSSIPGTFSGLILSYQLRSATAAANDIVLMRFNSDSGTNYIFSRENRLGNVNTTGAASMQLAEIPAASATAGAAAVGESRMPNYAATVFWKSHENNQSEYDGTNILQERSMGFWQNTAALTNINLFLSSGAAFVNGSTATLYGYP